MRITSALVFVNFVIIPVVSGFRGSRQKCCTPACKGFREATVSSVRYVDALKHLRNAIFYIDYHPALGYDFNIHGSIMLLSVGTSLAAGVLDRFSYYYSVQITCFSFFSILVACLF